MAIAELIMPKMGESIMEATILKWHKKVGDLVKMDETILDIATDKVDSEIPSPVTGIITEILYQANNVVPVGNVIARFQTDVASFRNEPVVPRQIQPEVVSAPAPNAFFNTVAQDFYNDPEQFSHQENIPYQPTVDLSKPGNNRFFSPLVLNIANSEGISLSELERIPGTGADGRVSKKDVIQYIADKRAGKVSFASPTPAPQPAPQVIYVQQPVYQEYQQPPSVIPTPVQEVVLQKQADAPVYVAPQPIVEQPVYDAQPSVERPQVIEQVAVEAIAHHPLVEPVIVPQPIVEQPTQTIVESVISPVFQPVVVAAAPVFQPVAEPIVEPAPRTVVVPQAIFVPQPIVEQKPIVEKTEHGAPAIPATTSPVVAPVLVAPIVQPTFSEPTASEEKVVIQPIAPQRVVERSTPKINYEELTKEIISSKETFVSEPIITKFIEEKPNDTHGNDATPKKLVPVYLVPPTVPTVPLVTLAEGESGKYTTPNSAHPSGNVEILEMDRMRKLIAKHMVDSKHISPHVTSFTEADVTNMVFWRERVKDDFERREGTKLTYTPMFIDCLVKVLKKYPLLNSSVEGDKIIIKKDLNIGLATALPTGNLIVPVIKGADQLNIVGLSAAVNKLSSDARKNQLKPDDVSGGTFTFTNVGTFGTLMGTPIINQPQVAILAVGIIKKRPVVIESPNNDTIGIRHMMYLSLSYDHRVIDGSVGASFLTDLSRELENWDLNRTWYHYL